MVSVGIFSDEWPTVCPTYREHTAYPSVKITGAVVGEEIPFTLRSVYATANALPMVAWRPSGTALTLRVRPNTFYVRFDAKRNDPFASF